MSRKIWVLLIAFFVTAELSGMIDTAQAKGISDLGPGCGLGKDLWRDSPNTDKWGVQILISTTNNTIVPFQAFGITSQTMGCKNSGKFWAEHKANMFAGLNFENLTQEMAQGGGEHLASMAALMGVSEDKQPEFFAVTQERYLSLVNAGEASPVAMVKALNEAAASSPASTTVAAK
ncbi:Orotate phosphoribosyltransferase (Modular protein) [Nitrospira japonica]|uniref:Orotate phosphoribosyltransferase (Modular protein) n=1 Tax=Nitrospira japonica TaxID=1325564 RepID=A0A1W1I1Y7_9BACT|nr:DUF3015 family protein [Nitrospira japonica]SLM47002.1 Orotate phosphoribosyltransferase (Modular protein) [Nitrospira japonica]